MFILLISLVSYPSWARKKSSSDSLSVTEQKVSSIDEKDSVAKTQNIYSWVYDGPLAEKKTAGIDTSMNQFYVNNPALRQTIALQYLGNMGSPAQSAIFADRKNRTDYIFFQPYQLYYTPSDELLYFNTKRPFSFIDYYGGGTNNRDNRRLKGLFSVNANKKLNLGMYGEWLKAYGAYSSLSTKNYDAGFFTSYDGLHSQFAASISFNGFESYENGGFTYDKNITDPKNTGHLDPLNIPVYFSDNSWTKVHNWNAAFHYKYNIGIEKEVQVTPDSVATEIIPVTTFTYRFTNESDWRRYYERNKTSGGLPVDSFYHSYGLSDERNYGTVSSTDSSRFWQMTHTFGVTLNEEYNTLMKFGLSAYITAKTKKYTYLDEAASIASGEVTPHNDSLFYFMNPTYSTEYRNKVGVGVVLSKHQGEAFTYSLFGEYFFLDEKKSASSFDFGGDLQSNAKWGKQQVMIGASAKFERYCPDFFEDYYFSNHIKWDNDFENKQDLNIHGYLSFPTFAFYDGLGLTFSADFKNLNNYVYWNSQAKPAQYSDNIQVLTLSLQERARIWRVHWDNELTFQKCSDDVILPLPQLSWYSSAYLQFNSLFKVLNIQLGVDMRWNSAYHAPNYMPATGQFFLQNSGSYTNYGNYLQMDAFINFRLKRARFYIEFNHLNKIWTHNYNSLLLRGYALDPSYLKFGLSLTLAD